MENLFIELVKMLNPIQLVAIGLIVFYFYNRQKDEIKDLRTEVNIKYDKLNDKYDKLNDLIIDLYKTLFKKDAA